MKDYILICSCFNMGKKASEAFSILFPDKVLPDIIKGRDRIFKFAEKMKNEHIKAISKLSGKYAYYICLDGDKIVSEYDLLRGSKLA